MNRLLCMASLVAAAIMCLSCERERISPDDGITDANDAVVSLSIGGDNTMTKSGLCDAASKTEVIADLSEAFGVSGTILTETVSDMDGIMPETKGTPVYTQNLNDVF